MTKLKDEILKIPKELWQGAVIAVDPSSGSQNSNPGFALADKGRLVFSGTLPIYSTTNGKVTPLHKRLHRLQKGLLEIVVEPDIVVIESLPPFMSGAGGDFRTARTISLHQSAGCVMATWDVDYLLGVPVISHQSLMKKLTKGHYVKSDENDAIAILVTAFFNAGVVLTNMDEVLQHVSWEPPTATMKSEK